MQDIRASGYQQIRISGYQENRMQNTAKPEQQEKIVAGFEKLWVWQKAHKLMQEIHRFCRTLPKEEKFKLRDKRSD